MLQLDKFSSVGKEKRYRERRNAHPEVCQMNVKQAPGSPSQVTQLILVVVQWGKAELHHNRRAFLRLWPWGIAVGTVEMAALYSDRLSLGVH